MKKLLSATLSLALAVSLLIGCTPSKTTTSGSSKPQQKDTPVSPPITDGKVTKLVPDETATGDLIVTCFTDDKLANIQSNDKQTTITPINIQDNITIAVEKFKELYPNVNIVINRGSDGLEYTDYTMNMSKQILEGEGPDVFFIEETNLDINKAIPNGVFADMYEFFKNDENFSMDDYNKTVFSGNQPEKSQYIIPVSYTIPYFFSTENMIKKSGLDLSKLTDYSAILKEFDRVFENKAIANVLPIWNGFSLPISFPTYSGIDRFDYSTKEFVLDAEKSKEIFELLKKHREKYADLNRYGAYETFQQLAEQWKKGELLLSDSSSYTPLTATVELYSAVSLVGEKPVLIPFRNTDGKITAVVNNSVAVNQNSKNKQNAYNFIKVLIAPESPPATAYMTSNIPISNKVLHQVLKGYISEKKLQFGIDTDTGMLMSDNLLTQYDALISEISNVDWNIYADRVFKSQMENYLNGNVDYDTCIAKAKEKVEEYLIQ